jgi:hypothetical protein
MSLDAIGGDIERSSAEDRAAITAVVRDYVEGWFDGDEARMRRCLHPELVKRTVWHDPTTGGWALSRPADAEMMVRWTSAGEGRTTIAEERAFEITIDDVFCHIASVRVLSSPYMDCLHLAKLDSRWFIANVLWEVRTGEETVP